MFPKQMFSVRANWETFRKTMFPRLRGPLSSLFMGERPRPPSPLSFLPNLMTTTPCKRPPLDTSLKRPVFQNTSAYHLSQTLSQATAFRSTLVISIVLLFLSSSKRPLSHISISHCKHGKRKLNYVLQYKSNKTNILSFASKLQYDTIFSDRSFGH